MSSVQGLSRISTDILPGHRGHTPDQQAQLEIDRDFLLRATEADLRASLSRDGSDVHEILEGQPCEDSFNDGVARLIRLWADGSRGAELGVEFDAFMQKTIDTVVAKLVP